MPEALALAGIRPQSMVQRNDELEISPSSYPTSISPQRPAHFFSPLFLRSPGAFQSSL